MNLADDSGSSVKSLGIQGAFSVGGSVLDVSHLVFISGVFVGDSDQHGSDFSGWGQCVASSSRKLWVWSLNGAL